MKHILAQAHAYDDNYLSVKNYRHLCDPHFCCEQSDSKNGNSDAWARRTHVRWLHGQSGRESTDCTLMRTHCVDGWRAWPVDKFSWCDVSELPQSGSRVRFMGETLAKPQRSCRMRLDMSCTLARMSHSRTASPTDARRCSACRKVF